VKPSRSARRGRRRSRTSLLISTRYRSVRFRDDAGATTAEQDPFGRPDADPAEIGEMPHRRAAYVAGGDGNSVGMAGCSNGSPVDLNPPTSARPTSAGQHDSSTSSHHYCKSEILLQLRNKITARTAEKYPLGWLSAGLAKIGQMLHPPVTGLAHPLWRHCLAGWHILLQRFARTHRGRSYRLNCLMMMT
jgi:hypothetical protein